MGAIQPVPEGKQAATVLDSALRGRLLDRRRRLQGFARGGEAYLHELLQEVDAALERLEEGTFGLCDVCHEGVEPERLLADPLCRVCLDHLLPEQRRALEQDLEMAGRIQASLLPPRELAFQGWQLHCRYLPLGPVSGDYYDLIRSGAEPALLLFGDVSGKGVAASLLVSHLHAIVRSLAGADLGLDRLVERANRIFGGSASAAGYATLVAARLAEAGRLDLVNAGHCPAVLSTARGVETLAATGLPVGLFSGGRYGSHGRQIERGDALVLYTDGLSEASNGAEDEFGPDRIAAVVERHRGAGAQELVEALLEELRRFQDGAPATDDVTVLAVRRAD